MPPTRNVRSGGQIAASSLPRPAIRQSAELQPAERKSGRAEYFPAADPSCRPARPAESDESAKPTAAAPQSSASRRCSACIGAQGQNRPTPPPTPALSHLLESWSAKPGPRLEMFVREGDNTAMPRPYLPGFPGDKSTPSEFVAHQASYFFQGCKYAARLDFFSCVPNISIAQTGQMKNPKSRIQQLGCDHDTPNFMIEAKTPIRFISAQSDHATLFWNRN